MRYILIFLVALGLSNRSQAKNKIDCDWLVIYYMPYDNDLSKYTLPIIQSIDSSISSNKVVSIIQSDNSDTDGITRFIVSNDGIESFKINEEHSAKTQTFEDFIKWAKSQVHYKHVLLAFLNHGGKLNEVCRDDYPFRSFLSVDSVNNVLSKCFTNEKLDLLFYQVCSKGSIEPLYEVKDRARYTLCSQTEIGAPNNYYNSLFRLLSTNPDIPIDSLVKTIVENDGKYMYSSYTFINNFYLDSVLIKLQYLLEKRSKDHTIQLHDEPISYQYGGEKYWDLISFISNLDIPFYTDEYPVKTELMNLIESKLIINHYINPRFHTFNFSGIGIIDLTTPTAKTEQLSFMRSYNKIEFRLN